MRANVIWSQGLAIYTERKVFALAILGISAGLPLPLIYGTPSIWLREAGLGLAAITPLSAVLFVYGIKFLWAPLADHLRLPNFLLRFGRRRSWMLAAQLTALLSMVWIGFSDPGPGNLTGFLVGITILALASATQDIALDAFRIESAPPNRQGAMAASYVFGYRIAYQLIGGAACLYLADRYGWTIAYCAMSATMLIGMVAVLCMDEPPSPLPRTANAPQPHHGTLARIRRTIITTIINPFREFWQRLGRQAAIIVLLLVITFRLCDLLLGSIAYLFYIDTGFSKSDIASVTKLFGFPMLLLGAVAGGGLVRVLGAHRMLAPAAFLALASNLGFLALSAMGDDRLIFTAVIAFDNIASGAATSVFIAFLSSLTSPIHTATQYALLSSVMVQLGKFLGIYSGPIAERIGYEYFFVYTAMLGIPAVILSLILLRLPNMSDTTREK